MDAPIGDDRRRKRWVWGCTGGCLGFLVAVGALIFLAYYVLSRPMPVPAAEALVAPGASALLVVRIEPDDPLPLEIVSRLAAEQEVGEAVAGDDARARAAFADATGDLAHSAAPMQAVVTWEPGDEEGAFHWTQAFAVRRWGRLMGMFIRGRLLDSGALAVGRYRKADLLKTTGKEVYVGVRRNVFVAADRRDSVEWVVDQLAEQAAQTGPAGPIATMAGELGAAYRALDSDSAVRFASGNEHGELERLLEAMESEEARQALREAGAADAEVVSFSGQVRSVSSRDAGLTLRWDCAQADFAARLGGGLSRLAAALPADSPLAGARVAVRGAMLVEVTATIPDVPGRFMRQFRKAAAGLPPAADAPSPTLPSP